MSKELIVSASRHETRVAILEDDQVVELFHEREKEYSLAGSIHKGRVTRVLPGMQSAFVDIGLERDAFLYVSDFFEDNDEYEAVVSTVEEKVLKMERGGGAPQLEQAKSNPAVNGDVSTEASAEISAAPPSAIAPASMEPRPEGQPRESQQREGQQRDGRDRGGRGRRGRRRRGGRGNGLPDSKFFSPRTESAPTQETEIDSASAEEPAPEVVSSFSRSEDFMVLPGESLAKYSPGDSDFEDSDLAPEESEPAAEASEPPVEAAVPVEHPLAGFGEVSSWASATPVETAAPEPEPVPVTPEPQSEPVAAAEVEDSTAAAEPADEVVPVATSEENGISASEVAEMEIADDVRAAEIFESNGSASDLTDEDASAAGEEVSAAPNTEPSESESAQEEGPEPARIPTSLTATLREQGHRYPHRISRRMRRKMRTSPSQEEGEQNPEGGQRPPRGENRDVSPRREDRGQAEGPRREDRGQGEGTREPKEQRQPRERQERERPERERSERERPERERPPLPSIADLLKEGQEIIVQIAKEPLGQKGARITSHIALPGRFVVYMPTVEHVGVSRKIPSDDERQRLKRILQTHRQGIPGGFICRTAAENKSEEELKSDMHFLYNLWLDMRQKAEKKPAPLLLHHDLDLVQRILRDQLTTSFKTIWVDNEELYEGILSFVQRFQPALVGRVKLYTRSNPIFDEFSVTSEIEKALRPKVWLKSGGYIVINQTEALVAIDINTGKYVGKSNRLEDTIVKINTDAIKEIVRQIRLRDLGGIIVVDFIDMDERKNRQKVMLALEECMRADRAPYKILQFNDFGLVAITRKRVKQSLERTLCSPCPYCEGAGYIKSVGTIVSEILQEANKMRKAIESEQSNVMLRVNPEVEKVLKSYHNTYLQEIEETLNKTVIIKSDPQLHQTKFDLA